MSNSEEAILKQYATAEAKYYALLSIGSPSRSRDAGLRSDISHARSAARAHLTAAVHTVQIEAPLWPRARRRRRVRSDMCSARESALATCAAPSPSLSQTLLRRTEQIQSSRGPCFFERGAHLAALHCSQLSSPPLGELLASAGRRRPARASAKCALSARVLRPLAMPLRRCSQEGSS